MGIWFYVDTLFFSRVVVLLNLKLYSCDVYMSFYFCIQGLILVFVYGSISCIKKRAWTSIHHEP